MPEYRLDKRGCAEQIARHQAFRPQILSLLRKVLANPHGFPHDEFLNVWRASEEIDAGLIGKVLPGASRTLELLYTFEGDGSITFLLFFGPNTKL